MAITALCWDRVMESWVGMIHSLTVSSFPSPPFPLPHWKCISIQWRNCSSTAFTKIILVISTQVSIILLNTHPTLLTVDRFHVVLLLLFPSSVLNRILCMTYHMLQMMKLWCENDDVITVCKCCSVDLWTIKKKVCCTLTNRLMGIHLAFNGFSRSNTSIYASTQRCRALHSFHLSLQLQQKFRRISLVGNHCFMLGSMHYDLRSIHCRCYLHK